MTTACSRSFGVAGQYRSLRQNPLILPSPSVTNLDQLGLLLLPADLLARCFRQLLLDVGQETIRAALQLRHQLFQDGVARFFARRIPLNRYLHLVLAGVVLVIDLRLFRHLRFPPVARSGLTFAARWTAFLRVMSRLS